MVRKCDTDLIRGHCGFMWHLSVFGPRADAAIFQSSVPLPHLRASCSHLYSRPRPLFHCIRTLCLSCDSRRLWVLLTRIHGTSSRLFNLMEVIFLRDKPKPGEEGIGWFALIRSPTGESQRCLRSGTFRLVRGWCPETVPRKRA